MIVGLVSLIATGCGDAEPGGSGGGDIGGPPDNGGAIFPDGEKPDAGTPEDAPRVTPTGTEKLEFKQAQGDDGNPCKGTDRCAVSMSFNSSRTLEVVASKDGKPVENLEISWQITKNPNDSLKLAANTSFTGGDGGTSNEASQVSQQVAQYEVKAWIGNSEATPLYFDVAVTPKGQFPLVVQYKYLGKRNFQAVTTFLFKHVGQKQFKCTDMDPGNLPTADLSSPPKSLTQSTAFTKLPGLEEEGEQVYTVIGIGKDKNGPALVWGCDDTSAEVSIITSTTVLVELHDLPPLWKGKYEVTTKFDLVSALPDNVEGIVNTVLGFFTDPAGQLLVLVCDLGSDVGVIGELCGFVFQDPKNPCLTPESTCFKSIGLTIKKLVTNLLEDLVKDNIAGDILFTGADIAKILKELELEATLEFKNEPKADGTFTTEDTAEEWHSVVYRWTLGTDCAPDDLECGKHKFNIQAFQDESIVSSFSGHVAYDDAKNMLHIDAHGLKLNYGKLLLYVIEKQLLPLIAGDGSDGNPKIDSFEEYLKILLGGKECLKWEIDPDVDKTCCQAFAENLTNSSTGSGLAYDVAKLACDAGLPLASDQLKSLLLGLVADSGDAFTIGTVASGCECYDHDANMTIDAWGSLDTPCKWNTTISFGDTPEDKVKIDNDFWAVEKQ